MDLTEILAPRLGGLEVVKRGPDFFQHDGTKVHLFQWTASYGLWLPGLVAIGNQEREVRLD